MTTEEKYNLTFSIIKKVGLEEDRNSILSIVECVKENRFLVALSDNKIVIFLTWEDNKIEGKRYIFVNNLWVEPEYRNSTTLTRIRIVLKYLLKNVYKFYWHNKKRDKIVYRR